MSDFDDDPRIPDTFDRLRSDADALDVMEPLRSLPANSKRGRNMKLGLLGGAVAAILVVLGVAVFNSNEPEEDISAVGPGAEPITEAYFNNSSWIVVDGTDTEGRLPDALGVATGGGSVLGVDLVATFADGRATLSGPCREYPVVMSVLAKDVSVSVGDNIADIVTGGGQCDDLDPIYARVVALLDGAQTITIGIPNTFSLSGAAGDLRFRRVGGGERSLTDTESDLDDDRPTYATAAQLEGTSWVLDNMTVPGQPDLLRTATGFPITLTFDRSQLGGNAGCNGYGGLWLVDSQRFEIAELGWEETACGDGPVMQTKATYLSILRGANEAHVLDGGRSLVVFSSEPADGLSEPPPGGSLVFVAGDPVPIQQITGRSWNLETVTQGNESFDADSALYGLEIRADGTMTLALPCRSIVGDYVVFGSMIVPTSLSSSDQACRLILRPNANIASSVIESGFTAQIRDGKLVLTTSGGESLTWVEGEAPSDPDGTAGLSLTDLDGTQWRLFEGLVGDSELSAGADLQLSFSGSNATAGNACSRFSPNVEVVGGAIDWLDAPAAAGCDIDEFLIALAQTTTVSMFANTQPRVLELFGPDIQLNFEEVIEGNTPVLTIDELLDLRPTGVVTLATVSEILSYGGTTIVCGGDAGAPGPTCDGRWVVVTNYNSLVDGEQPLTVVLREDGRFQIVSPGSGVAERGSGVEVTPDDIALTDWFLAGFFDRPALAEQPDPRFDPDGITLWLGAGISELRSFEDPSDHAAWTLDIADFDGLSGPFNIFEQFEQVNSFDPVGETKLTVGPHNHCAGQPLLLPESLQGLRQLSIQPTGIDSCLQWFAVDVFVDDAGSW